VLKSAGQNNRRAPNINNLGALHFAEDIFCRISIPASQSCYVTPQCRKIIIMIILDSNGKRIKRNVVFDVETTGLSLEHGDRVIEIGAVALDGTEIIDEFHSLISVYRPIDPDAGCVHGITAEMLCDQPRAEQIMPQFHSFIGNSLLVAHSAEFDMRFIGGEFARLKLRLRNAYCCTLALGRKLLPGLPRHDLETLYRELYGRAPDRLHRALDDARTTAEIWIKLSCSFGDTTPRQKPL
jgi:DNA polymerase-3 subunit epsilon